MDPITFKNIGPIEELSIPVLPEGGIVEVLGDTGKGKSTALRVIARMLGVDDEAEVSQRRGSVVRGTADWGDLHLTVGRQTRMSGELSIKTLEGLDPSALAEPGFDDPQANDDRRIAILCTLVGAKATLDLFADADARARISSSMSEKTQRLVGGPLPEFVVSLKADLFARRRAHVEAAKQQAARAAGIVEAAGEELSVPEGMTSESLARRIGNTTAQLVRAKQDLVDLDSRHEAAAALRETIENTMDETAKLDDLANEGAGLEDVVTKYASEIEGLKERIANLQSIVKQNQHRIAAIAQEVESIKKRALARKAAQSQLEEVLSRTGVRSEIQAQIVGLESALDATQRAHDNALLNEQRARKIADADLLRAKAAEEERLAEIFLETVRYAEGILSEQLGKLSSRGLRVEDSRLVATNLKGDPELFERLSEGEKYTLAVDVMVDALGEGACLVLRQGAWGEFSPSRKRELREHAKRRKVRIYTARATHGDLRAVEFVPESEP